MSEIRIVMNESLEEKVHELMNIHKISSKRDLVFYLISKEYEEKTLKKEVENKK